MSQQLAQQLTACGLPVFPCTPTKRPAVKGWQIPQPCNTYHWASGKIGVPIPAGVYVVDLDVYKGVTRQQVDELLGCQLPWDAALVQTTASGGQHYAFNHTGADLMQGADLFSLVGFDTRRAGSGFIVTGDGYTPAADKFGGVAVMAYPQSLPPLPPAAAAKLVKPERQAEKPTRPLTAAEMDNMKSALATIDPSCGRDVWWRVLAAARHLTAHDPESGLEIIDAWSSGEYSADAEPPENYQGLDDIEHQWVSTGSDGGIAGGTLYHMAMEQGWRPPAGFDVAAVFGQGSAPVDVYADLIDTINAHALDPKKQPGIIDTIVTFPGSASQVATLRSLMIKLLKEEGQLTKQIKEMLDSAKTAPSASIDPACVAAIPALTRLEDVPQGPISRATSAHGSNALIMLAEIFGGRLAEFDGVLRWWTGIEWQAADEDTLMRLASAALSPDQDKMPNVKGTVQALMLKAPRRKAAPVDSKIYFQNGVLDLSTQMMYPHSPDNNNTGALAVSYDPNADRGEWDSHMARLFGGLYDGAERVALLQEIIGWLMVTDNLGVEKCVAFDGATRAGKGVILNAIAQIVGSQKAGYVNFATMASGKTQSLFRTSDVVIDHEAKAPKRLEREEAIGFLNKVSSNEPVSVPVLYSQTPWTGRLNTKFLIACNGIPVMIDDYGASTSRFLVLRFDRSFLGKEDLGIGDRMAACYEGVAAWAVAGLQRLIGNRGTFTAPPSSTQALDDMRDGNQPLREFLDGYCEIGEGQRCHSRELWEAYRIYAASDNVKLCTRTAFLRSLRATVLSSGVQEVKSLRINQAVSNGFVGLGVKASGAAAVFGK
jgi:P4 family phage/plasmid primase-like protien